MDWTSKEAGQLFEQWGKSKGEGDDVLAVASLAVRLFLARASGQVREQGESFAKYHDERAGYGGASREFHERAASWCRTVAALAQEAESLRAKVAELEARLRHAEGAEERHKNHAEVARSEVERLKAMACDTGEAHATAEARAIRAESRLAAIREWGARIRKTRMGDGDIDAALHGNGNRMRLGRLISDLLSLTSWLALEGDAPTTRCPGTLPECSAGCPWHGVGSSPDEPQDAVKEAMEAAENLAAGERGLQRAHDNGAEAMRAACLTIALEWAKEQGFRGEALENIKHRIEGAAP